MFPKPTKQTLLAVGIVFASIWAIKNVDALRPVEDALGL